VIFIPKKIFLTHYQKFSASGGTSCTCGDYTFHIFNSSDTLSLTGRGDIELLIIGGGGGGGTWSKGAGGGGAGGVLYTKSQFVSGGNYTITVGSGGSLNSSGGSSSIIGPGLILTAYGGGYGGSDPGVPNGGYGGSGGGGANHDVRGLGGPGIACQGNSGGNTLPSNYDQGAGGGGAGGIGGTGSRNLSTTAGYGGNGGSGSEFLIAACCGLNLGDSNYENWFAGGGAGVGQDRNAGVAANVGAKGKGGGGGAGNLNGQPNTGGGGAAGGIGGSGIVIVAYPNTPSYNDGTISRPFASPVEAARLNAQSSQSYYFQGPGMRSPILLIYEANYYDNLPWCKTFSSPYAGTATVNAIDYCIPMHGLLVERDTKDHRAAVYFNTMKTYNTVNYLTADSGYTPRKVILGYAGGHGIYNPNYQNQCNWARADGAIGAGWDGSTCGSFPNGLRWGTGQSTTSIYANRSGTWEHWVTWS